jgi:RNA 3'-phosphate cyclase
MAQHLTAVLAVQQICDAEVKGAELNSTELEFYPKDLASKTISIDVGTAGSTTLILQALLLPSIFAPDKVRIKLKGGTDTKWSMPYDYFENVFHPHIAHLANFKVKLLQRGYYPKGGGKLEITIHPKLKIVDFNSFEAFIDAIKQKFPKFNLLESGELKSISGISHAASELKKAEVAKRQIKGAKQVLLKLDCNIKIDSKYSDSLSLGSGITLWANTSTGAIIGADALGERGVRAEDIGRKAAQNLLAELEKQAPADKYLADQLIVYLALLGGIIKTTEISNHTLTNIAIVEKFIDVKFKIDEKEKKISV